MLFAPAIGIVSFQVLGWLCWFVSLLCAIGMVRQWLSPTSNLEIEQLLKIAIVFAIGGFACLWVSRKIRQIAKNT
jgi:hypothetical protein